MLPFLYLKNYCLVDGFGNKKLLGSKHVAYKFFDSGVEYLEEDPSILPEELGIPFRFEMLKYVP